MQRNIKKNLLIAFIHVIFYFKCANSKVDKHKWFRFLSTQKAFSCKERFKTSSIYLAQWGIRIIAFMCRHQRRLKGLRTIDVKLKWFRLYYWPVLNQYHKGTENQVMTCRLYNVYILIEIFHGRRTCKYLNVFELRLWIIFIIYVQVFF